LSRQRGDHDVVGTCVLDVSPTDSKAAQLAVFAAGRMTCLLEESQRAIAAKVSRRASLRGPRQRPGEGHGLLQVNGLDGCPTDTSSRLITRCNFSSFYTPPRIQTPNDDTEPARSGQGVRDGGLADLCGNECLAFPSRRGVQLFGPNTILSCAGEAKRHLDMTGHRRGQVGDPLQPYMHPPGSFLLHVDDWLCCSGTLRVSLGLD
jgi:hypothetical protein